MTDEKIVGLCRRCNGRAFDLLTAKYGSGLYAFINSMAGGHAATDEILQETFIKAFGGIGKYGSGGGFRGWIYRIAYNECLDYLKSEARRACREREYGEARLASETERGSVETIVLRRESAARAREALMELPENQRTAIRLFAVDGFSIKEIAAVMGCAEGTVMSHLHRARRAMRERLAEEIDQNE